MNASSTTPTTWVGRLAIANAAVLVVLRTVLTAESVPAALRFDPSGLAGHPWSVATYPFVHDSVLHLAAVTLLLLTVGPTVERRMGGRGFLLYYCYCAIGAALVAMVLAGFMPVPPMAGGLAPVLGLVFAYAVFAEDREVALDPIPLRAGVRTLLAAFGAAVLVVGLAAREPGLSVAHVGGFLVGWVFFRLRSIRHQPQPTLSIPIRRPVMAPIRQEAEAASVQASAAATPHADLPADDTEHLNRVLDKISAQGIDSLTPEERRRLTDYSERKRRERA
jgi:membrane associated rhomboid family serine protease